MKVGPQALRALRAAEIASQGVWGATLPRRRIRLAGHKEVGRIPLRERKFLPVWGDDDGKG